MLLSLLGEDLQRAVPLPVEEQGRAVQGSGEEGNRAVREVWSAFQDGERSGGEKTASGPGQVERATGAQGDVSLEKALAARAPAAKNSFELLNFSEMMDPALKVEPGAGNLLDRLQQVLESRDASTLFDRAAEVVRPQVVRGLVALARAGVAEMRLQLQPADLGDIQLRVRTTEGVVRGEMLVQHPEIKYLLEHQLERLRTALAHHGLELGGFDVGMAQDGSSAWPDQADKSPAQGLASAAKRERNGAVIREGESGSVHRSLHGVDYLI